MSDLTVEHYVDCASAQRVQYCLTGKPIPEAALVMRKTGGAPFEYLKIMMEDVIITRVAPASRMEVSLPREQINLSFARVKQE